MEISDLVGLLLIYLGLLLILVVLHLVTINSIGATAEVLNKVFIVFFWCYIGALVFGLVYEVIHLLRWMVWSITTPTWIKNKK